MELAWYIYRRETRGECDFYFEHGGELCHIAAALAGYPQGKFNYRLRALEGNVSVCFSAPCL